MGVFTPFVISWISGCFSLAAGLQMKFPMDSVKKLEHFKQKNGYAIFCPVGQAPFDETVDLICRVVLRCRRQKIKKLLIDSTGLPGFKPPDIAKQYNVAGRIARDAASLVKIAHVGNAEWIRSGKFSVTVARNRGLDAKNFLSASNALAWLLKPARNKCSASKSA
jgi:hypothetical protein